MTVMLGKEGFEVTTYRVDGEYEDCRHPKEVQFKMCIRDRLWDLQELMLLRIVQMDLPRGWKSLDQKLKLLIVRMPVSYTHLPSDPGSE